MRSKAALSILTTFLLAVAATAPASARQTTTERALPGAGQPTSDAWKFEWRDSFRLTSPDGRTSLRFGGRLQNDWAFFANSDELASRFGRLTDGTELRRARLFFSGELYGRVVFKAQYDFAGGKAAAKDVYVGLAHLPVVGSVRIGHQKEPFSLEDQTSSKYITFLEKALPIEAFSPSRNNGLLLGEGRRRVTWKVGVFKETDDFGKGMGGEWNVSARLTGLPLYRDGGRHLLHLGLSVSDRHPVDDEVRFRSRPEAHLAERLADTGPIAADGLTLLDLEGAFVDGPFSLQGESIHASVRSPDGSDPQLASFYLYGSYFLTGEHRRYRTSTGAFDRTRPSRDLGSGPGAWEVAVRYSSLDLTDAGVEGGRLDDWTAAVNWYLYSNVRAMLDYVSTKLRGSGSADIVEMRFQVDF